MRAGRSSPMQHDVKPVNFECDLNMPEISWNDELLTGNAFIDEDHRKLASMVNAFLDALSKGQGNDVVAKVLNNLMVYTRSHFDREEAEMQRINYPGTLAHKAEHTRLMNEVHALKAKMESGEKISATAVFTFLNTWLRHHILEVDMKLAAAMRQGS